MKIQIYYCAACGHLSRAVGLTEQILSVFKDVVSSVELIPVIGGRFEILLNDRSVYSKQVAGQLPTWAAVEQILKAETP